MGAVHLPLPLCQRRILILQRWHGSSLARQHYNEPCGASIVAHFARKVRGTNLWRIMQRIQLSPHFHLRAPHFASKVSYSAARQSELQCFTPSLILVSERGPCDVRLWAVRQSSLGRATIVSGSCDDRLWAVQRPSLGRATIASGPCDDRTPSRVRHQTVASCRSISFLRFPLAAPPCFFYFHPAEKANADGNSRGNGSFNTIFIPFHLTISK